MQSNAEPDNNNNQSWHASSIDLDKKYQIESKCVNFGQGITKIVPKMAKLHPKLCQNTQKTAKSVQTCKENVKLPKIGPDR